MNSSKITEVFIYPSYFLFRGIRPSPNKMWFPVPIRSHLLVVHIQCSDPKELVLLVLFSGKVNPWQMASSRFQTLGENRTSYNSVSRKYPFRIRKERLISRRFLFFGYSLQLLYQRLGIHWPRSIGHSMQLNLSNGHKFTNLLRLASYSTQLLTQTIRPVPAYKFRACGRIPCTYIVVFTSATMLIMVSGYTATRFWSVSMNILISALFTIVRPTSSTKAIAMTPDVASEMENAS